jgi:competence protein ComEA
LNSPIHQTANDLAISLDLSTKETDAIIHRCEENGAFKTLDDLKTVPGLDIAKIEARKDRLTF